MKGLDGFDWGSRIQESLLRVQCFKKVYLLARYSRSLLMWRSTMQKSIAVSTAEAEYYSVSEMAIEMIYLRNLLANMGLPQEDYTELLEDKTACIRVGWLDSRPRRPGAGKLGEAP